MLGAVLTFFFLYGLIYVFERDRDDLDGYTIALAVGGPVIIMWLVQIGAAVIGLGPWIGLIGLATLAIATYLILTIHLEIKPGHAIAYTAAVVVFYVVLNIGLTYLTRPG